jgi:hypothetical protein
MDGPEDKGGQSVDELKLLMQKTSIAIAKNRQSLEITRVQIEKTRKALEDKENFGQIQELVAENKKLIEQNRLEISEMHLLMNEYQQAFDELRRRQLQIQQSSFKLLPLAEEKSIFIRKTPSVFEDLDYLESLLRQYEAKEDYESCVLIRDRIKLLKNAA